MFTIYTTQQMTKIYIERGGKSGNDFIVRYQEIGKRIRTPKHIHLVIDIYAKRTGDINLTNQLLDYFLECIISYQPSDQFPPRLQFFTQEKVATFSPLDKFGEYPVEFLLVVTELILIQEKTNYPQGRLNQEIFSKLRKGADIFSIVSSATFTGR